MSKFKNQNIYVLSGQRLAITVLALNEKWEENVLKLQCLHTEVLASGMCIQSDESHDGFRSTERQRHCVVGYLYSGVLS